MTKIKSEVLRLTKFDVVASVNRIAEEIKEHDDDERAHGMEDDLHQQVLYNIAYYSLDPEEARTLAREALETQNIKFARWCA